MPSPEQRISIETPAGAVSGALAVPRGAVAVIVLAHGAGGNMDGPFLSGFTRALNADGIGTLRFNFRYSEIGRRAPDPERTLRAVWIAAFDEATRHAKRRPVFAGGKSLGGRIASMCTADDEISPSGLLFLGYPLHPPGKPEKLRDAHLGEVGVPMLFLQGTKDPFAKPTILAPVLRRLGRRAEHVEIDGGDHSFRVRGAKRDDREIGASLAEPAAAFIRRAI
ncbi:MAG: alpha/beta family hydrolase [Actinomycetota bacterium]